MRTYFIVSPNVIREALWLGSPLTVKAVHQISQNPKTNWEYDSVICESDGRYDLQTLKEIAQACFCDDITVFGCHRSSTGEIVLSLDIRLKMDGDA